MGLRNILQHVTCSHAAREYVTPNGVFLSLTLHKFKIIIPLILALLHRPLIATFWVRRYHFSTITGLNWVLNDMAAHILPLTF